MCTLRYTYVVSETMYFFYAVYTMNTKMLFLVTKRNQVDKIKSQKGL